MSTCVFCMIARDEIPAKKRYEDELIVAFDDIAPQAPVHVLVIPREHYDDMGDDVPEATLAAIFAQVPRIARERGRDENGYRVIVNNGRDANQTVGHLHVHIIGGRAMSHGMVSFEE